MRDIIVLSNHLILPEVIPPPHLPTVATLGVPCYMSLSSPPYMRHRHSPISLIIIATLNDIGIHRNGKNTVSSYLKFVFVRRSAFNLSESTN